MDSDWLELRFILALSIYRKRNLLEGQVKENDGNVTVSGVPTPLVKENSIFKMKLTKSNWKTFPSPRF